MTLETYEQQSKDSDMIFTQVTSGSFEDYEQAERTVVTFYAPDLTISRAGISHALKRLQQYYRDKNDVPAS